MAKLSRELRRALERVVLAARGEAEAGARKAIEQLAVAHHEPWSTMTADQQRLRRRLRARGRQLGDRLEDGGKQSVERLVSECAYEQWHRMLFARFLAECGLLREPASGVSVSVDECKELARARGVDWIALASDFTQGMLPQIFRADDAVLEVVLPAEHRQPIEQSLMSLPAQVFLADDSLGWVYQFWQSEEKDRVNASEKKIGADTLSAVTQLFTEDYMVEFLLHNTLGAWWAGRRFSGGVEAESEEDARAAVRLPSVEWTYLRFLQNDEGRWVPAAGQYLEWPTEARLLRVLDPSMGSGHFLVSALPMLVGVRQLEEQTVTADACIAVLRDNLFGLELDPRCTQIAAFNLALSAWKLSGWRALPPLNLACSGMGPNARREQWLSLAGDDDDARRGMDQLYDLFAQAPLLGSLIDPKRLGRGLFVSDFHDLQPILQRALSREQADDSAHELAVAAQGVAKAAEILADQFTLVITNVPYLGRGKHDEPLRRFCEQQHPLAKADLATSFTERCVAFCAVSGTAALVTPQNWWFHASSRAFRARLLSTATLRFIATLGEEAWQSFGNRGPVAVLFILGNQPPINGSVMAGVDALSRPSIAEKIDALERGAIVTLTQSGQYGNPDHRITIKEGAPGPLLEEFADSYLGLGTCDAPHYTRCFWELPVVTDTWACLQGGPSDDSTEGGREQIVAWDRNVNRVLGMSEAERQQGHNQDYRGRSAWGRSGVAISLMRNLRATPYAGDLFEKSIAVLIPKRPATLSAIRCFVESPDYSEAVRRIDKKVMVTNATLVKVPFDLPRWQRAAEERYPDGVPAPRSADPTQWLFGGHPLAAEHPLQVAVARLLGYRWPRQTGSGFAGCPPTDPDALDSLADDDGIVCISSVKGEEPAAERLGRLLGAIYGVDWGASKQAQLFSTLPNLPSSLEDWLINDFFAQHCQLFHQRPFIWHIWDGRRDGFGALLNYHRLTRHSLETLTFAHLGDWIRRQEAGVETGEPGSEARLVSARQLQVELKNILNGQPPYDLFVRWKPLSGQAVGWEPDLNDGVRVNIRPFVSARDVGTKGAGILRAKPGVKWDKDRGKDPVRPKEEFPWSWSWDGKASDFVGGSSYDGNRWTDLHYSREFKIAARRQKGLA